MRALGGLAACYVSRVSDWVVSITVTVGAAVIVAVLFWSFTPVRNRLEPVRLRRTRDRGVRLSVYVDPDDMEGLDLQGVLGVTTGLHPGVNCYFPRSTPQDRLPSRPSRGGAGGNGSAARRFTGSRLPSK